MNLLKKRAPAPRSYNIQMGIDQANRGELLDAEQVFQRRNNALVIEAQLAPSSARAARLFMPVS